MTEAAATTSATTETPAGSPGATATAPEDPKPQKKSVWVENPEEYRMTLGEHLEELRWRLILALGGMAVVLVFCLIFGNTVTSYFCAPLYNTLKDADINPQLYYTSVGESFMVYIHISLICAGAIAAPWILYQLWLFVAAGLYPKERKTITRYLPLSIGLLVAGMLFVYFFVLPWTLQFFIQWGTSIPIPPQKTAIVAQDKTPPLMTVPAIEGDPESPGNQTLWYNTLEKKLKYHINDKTNVIQFLPLSLVAPHITLQTYIDMVMMMLITFALAFQLPIVVMALIRIGIVQVPALKKARKMVYFVLMVLAACITPGDVITATVALMVPLILLYELGIFLGIRGQKRAEMERATEEAAEKAEEEAARAAETAKAAAGADQIKPEDRMK